MVFPLLCVPVAAYVLSLHAHRPHSSVYALVVSGVVTGIGIVVLGVVAFFRRRCPACGKLRVRTGRSGSGRGEVLTCRSCGYEEAKGWAYRTGGPLH